jgi:hypothetical protein
MDLGEIIKDAVKYPTSNIKALLVYLILGLLVGVVEVLTGITSLTRLTINFEAGIVFGIIGIILLICLLLLMLGFSTDVIKFGINRSSDAPEIDLARQISNGLKYLIVSIVYMIIPIIIILVLGAIFQHWIVTILGLIIAIIFAFALTMAICRLAKTDSLGNALDIGGAIEDLKAIGIGKVIITIIAATIVGLVIVFILTFILAIILNFAPADLTTPVVSIVAAILDAWLLFYENRVMGLLYSDIA